ncbi:MAG: FAD binding domain-containing protein [Actinobacteria bacterium]|nr:FAD binding domain-containing protein [Actinomycetota bacterium]
MIPASFDYIEADSVEHALALLAHHDDSKLIAGGHSLVPMMKLRLATPAVLIDIGRLDELSRIEDRGDHVAVGALARHRSVEQSTLLAQHVPLLAHVAAQIGDPQVRNRGTMGGSLVHGDPASDLPAAALALSATMVIAGADGARRDVQASEFFRGFMDTAVGEGEMLVEVRYPKQTAGWNYQKFCRRAMDYAIVGVAVQLGARPGIALVNMGSVPHFAAAASAALAAGSPAARVAELVTDGTQPLADANATEDYRRHLARTLTARALAAAGHA